jgi:hypothetical protein
MTPGAAADADVLVVGAGPNVPRTWDPVNLQLCDPRRPTTVVSGGPGRRRWEFMRMPGETTAELNNEQTAWRLLAPWQLTPENCVLERHAIYTHRGRTGLLDDVAGAGFVLACREDSRAGLDQAFLDAIGTHVLHLVPAGTPPGPEHEVVDVDGTYLAYLGADHYLFGTAATLDDLPALIGDLRRQLAADAPAQATAVPAADPAVPVADSAVPVADPAVSGPARS